MPLYEFACRECETRREEFAEIADNPAPRVHCRCGARNWRRVFTAPSIHRGMRSHFNVALGRHVTSQADFQSKMSEASDVATARTGIDHKFVAGDPGKPTSEEGARKLHDLKRARAQ